MKKLIVGNVKMNILYLREREQFLKSFRKEARGAFLQNSEVVICPPFVHMEAFAREQLKNIAFGAQDIFWERKGSFTGEISPVMIKEFGAIYVIIGHSERRAYLGETDEILNKKILAAAENNLTSIVCVGESLDDRRTFRVAEVIEGMLERDVQDFPTQKLDKLVVAYEPIWSIGSGQTPTTEEIAEVRFIIQEKLAHIFGRGHEQKVRILYGGSVNSLNVRMTCHDALMDGVLIGRESLHPDEFFRIAGIVDEM